MLAAFSLAAPNYFTAVRPTRTYSYRWHGVLSDDRQGIYDTPAAGQEAK